VDQATLKALDDQAISSSSIMVPCPWLTEVADYAKAHPGRDLGIHLTLTSEWKTYRWGAVASSDQVPSLLDPDGYLWPTATAAAQHEKPEEVEREIRAQVERAKRMGIEPTHLDSHMGTLFQTPELFAVYVKVAREYHLPLLAARIHNAPPAMLSLLTDKDILVDSVVSPGEDVSPAKWMDFYLDAIRNMKPGLTEMIVHLGYDDAELQAISVDHPGWGAAWRQRDFNVVTSPEFKQALEENHISVIHWKDLGKLVQ
jgi:predicted glycoside hydrolase/deacetylase ChbG (UPF0249 family)